MAGTGVTQTSAAFTGEHVTASATSTYGRTTWLFLRLLGVVYLAAFWSLSGQIVALAGRNGITPAPQYVAAQYVDSGFSRILLSDAALHWLCLAGIGGSALLVVGLVPVAMMGLLWLAYFQLSIACADFLSYQWDALLLEVGFLAIFIAPWVWRERWQQPRDPPRLGVWLFEWLLFRVMFASGAAKLASGDITWRHLTALSFHFETQPIPTPFAWYVHALPRPVLTAMSGLTLFIELAVPFLLLAPRRLRRAAFVPLAGLQVIIALTGNYAFFNLLAIALCLFLLDDGALPGRIVPSTDGRLIRRFRVALLIAVAVVTIPISVFMFTSSFRVRLPGAAFVQPLATIVLPYRIVNRYGLFAVMTTTRPEIVIEGSEDGVTWREYEFKYKVGDVRRRPPWVAPHQPRLDWQMWFAALGEFDSESWFQDFCARLLEADTTVIALLARDPFAGRKPQFVRAILYQYRFSSWRERHADGVWWVRERLGNYSPVMTRPGQ
jgi:hypothetical protein